MQIQTYHTERGAKAFAMRVCAKRNLPVDAVRISVTCGLDFRDKWYVEVNHLGRWIACGPLKVER